jgi:hypothetical protein
MWQFAVKCVQNNLKQRKNAQANPFQVPLSRLKSWEKAFKMLHLKLKRGQALSTPESQEYRQILFLMDFQCISRWVLQVALVVEKESKEEQQRKSQKGLMGFLWGKKAEEPEKSQDYEALFAEMEAIEDRPLRQDSAVEHWLGVSFELDLNNLALKDEGNKEEVTMTSRQIYVQAKLAADGFEADLSVQNTIWTYVKSTENGVISKPFCTPSASASGKILSIRHVLYPSTSDLHTLTQVRSQPVDFVYLPEVLHFLERFFDVSDAEQSVKTLAWDAVQEITDTTNEKLLELLHSGGRRQVELDLAAPVITISLCETEQFRLSLGSFRIANETKGAEDNYEEFALCVSQVKLDYVSAERCYPVLQPLTFNASAHFLKSALKVIKSSKKITIFDDLPDMIFIGVLESINFNLSLGIYRAIVELIDKSTAISAVSEANRAIEREKVMKAADLTGHLWQTTSKARGWSQVFGVLSGAYLYCYSSEDSLSPIGIFYIKDCSLTAISEDQQRSEAIKVTIT